MTTVSTTTKLSEVRQEVERIFNLQKANQQKSADSTTNERRKKLDRLHKTVLKYRQEIRDALYQDFRKHPSEVDIAEIYAVQQFDTEILKDDEAYTLQYDPYFRLDFKIGYQLNSSKKKIAQQFFLDFQNITADADSQQALILERQEDEDGNLTDGIIINPDAPYEEQRYLLKSICQISALQIFTNWKTTFTPVGSEQPSTLVTVTTFTAWLVWA